MDIASKGRVARIRELNDGFRSSFSGGRIMMTAGVIELPEAITAKALELVATFDQFSEDNDPHGEHDFGSFELVNRTFFWKIDYYDPQCEFGSEDPADPAKTTRILTIMLAEEY